MKHAKDGRERPETIVLPAIGENLLVESRKRYTDLFDNMPSGVAVYAAVDGGSDFVFVDFNRAGERIDKIPKEEVVGKRVTQVFPKVKEFGLLEVFQRVYRTGKPESHPLSEYQDGRISCWRENHVYKLPTSEIVAVYDDITERKRGEDALMSQHEVLQALINTSQMPVFSVDNAYRYTSFNRAHSDTMNAIYGTILEEGKSILEYMTVEEDRQKAKANLDRALKGESFTEEAFSGDEALSRRYFEVKHSPVRTPDGKIIGASVFAADITEREKYEGKLREGEGKYRTLLENLPQKIFLKDKDSVYLSCNENYARDLKIKAEEIAGKTDYDFFPKELAEKYRADDKRILDLGETEDLEEKYIQNRQEAWVHTIKTPVRDAKGNIVATLGVFWDITESKMAGEKIKESEESLRAIMKASPIGISRLKDRIIDWVNDESCKITGYTAEELKRRNTRFLYPSQEEYDLVGENLYLNGWCESRLVRKDGSTVDVSMQCAPLSENSYIVTFTDITEKKKMENEITTRLDEMERFHKVAVDRELTMIELKKKLKELEDKAGKGGA